MVNGKKSLNLINNLLSGIGIIVLGIIIVKGSISMYTKVVNLFVYIFIIYGISKLINFLLNRKIIRNGQNIFSVILNILFGIIMLLFPKIPLSILPIFFSIYLFFNSLVKFINYYILKGINLKSRYSSLFFSIFFLIFSSVFLFYPIERLNIFIMIIGIYCLMLGVNKIFEFIIDLLSEKFKLKIRRKLKITLPAFFEAFIPSGALNSINKNKTKEQIIDEKYDLHVFIHLSKYGFNKFGHMDIMFEDKIYSYGNYDPSSLKFFETIGDGVLFIIKNQKLKYIDFCIETSKKTIVEYGINLTEEEKNKIRNKLNRIMEDTYSWEPNAQKDKRHKSKYKEYASKLYVRTKADFYKFKTSKYKKYFVLGVNCSYFVDYLLKNYVFEVLKLVGIISPGTYYEFLEENYRKKNSKVVSKNIYTKENIGELYVKDKK